LTVSLNYATFYWFFFINITYNTYTHTHIHTYNTYTHTHIHTYTHTHIHTYTHTHIHITCDKETERNDEWR